MAYEPQAWDDGCDGSVSLHKLLRRRGAVRAPNLSDVDCQRGLETLQHLIDDTQAKEVWVGYTGSPDGPSADRMRLIADRPLPKGVAARLQADAVRRQTVRRDGQRLFAATVVWD